MSTHAKRPFRKATGIPGHVPPLRPQTAKRNVSNDIIVEEKPPSLQQNYQRPPTVIRNKATVSKPDSRIAPRKGPQITNLPSKRPTTAQPIKAAKSNQIQGEIDYEAESAKLREECRKEFGVSIDEKDIDKQNNLILNLQYHNYLNIKENLMDDIDESKLLNYLCKYNCWYIVDFLLKNSSVDVNTRHIYCLYLLNKIQLLKISYHFKFHC